MAVEIRYSGQVVSVQSMRGTVTARAPSYTAEAVSGVLSGGVPFDGPYEVTPTSGEQVLPTRSKTMGDDLTVHAVPCSATSNDAGGYTFSILS